VFAALTQHKKQCQRDLSTYYISSWENYFSKFSKMWMFFSTQSHMMYLQFHFQ